MKLALHWALVTICCSVGWLLIGLISTETLVQGGLFLIFFVVSALVGVLGHRSTSPAIITEVEPNIKPVVGEPNEVVQRQKPTNNTRHLRIENSRIEYPFRRCMPGDEPARVTISKSIESSFPPTVAFPTVKNQSGTDSKRTSELVEGIASKKVAMPMKIYRRVKVFDPSHYSRHAGVPGFLYIARNNFHQVGLHKIGYTTLPPPQRIKTLNQQHSQASDVGNFVLVHAVQVSGSYDAEQALFDAISETRVAEKREYFFEQSDFLIRAVKAASIFNNGNPYALNDFLDWSLDQESWEKYRPPICHSATVPPKLKSTEGWIYVARNSWHRESIFRIGHSKNDPEIMVDELNRKQRELTCQIGFYKLVKCFVVEDLKGEFSRLMTLVNQYKIPGSRVFFDVSLSKVTDAIIQAAQSGRPLLPTKNPRMSTDQISVDIVPTRAHSSWAAWAACCPGCHRLLRFKGAVAAAGIVSCPSCGGQIACAIGPAGVEIL